MQNTKTTHPPFPIRLIATDIDGTVLPRGGAVSDVTRRVVAACWARGIPFVIATGRWIGAIREVQQALGLVGRPCIIANGGAVLDGDGGILQEWITPEADARRVCDHLRRFPVMVNTYVRDGLFRMNTPVMGEYLKKYVGDGDPRIVTDDEAAFEARGTQNVYKIEAYSYDTGLIARLGDEVRQMGMDVSSASVHNIEIMAPGFGKGTALTWLARHLGVDAGDTMAFGDFYNDAQMLKSVGWPVAMGNGVEALKRIARIVAPDDADDGVAKVVSEIALGERL